MRKHLRNYIMAAAALLAANLVTLQYGVLAGHYDHDGPVFVIAAAVSTGATALFLRHLIRKWRRGDAA